MKKHLFLKSLLMAIGLLVASINSALGQTFGAGGQQQTAIQSHQIMNGGAYNGTVYEPFGNSTPSEQSAVGASQAPAKAPGGPRKTRTPGEATSGTDLSPIGEPWVMVIFALGFIGIIFIRKRNVNITTNMKKITKHFATLALFLTIGFGNVLAGSYRIYLKPTSIWNGGSAKFSIHYWNSSKSEDKWMVKDGDYYYYDVPDWANKIIFIRNKNTASTPGFGQYWAKTGDLDCPSSRIYQITSYGSGDPATSSGSWKNIWLGGRTLYVDANNFGWDKTISSGPYVRIGKDAGGSSGTTAERMTKVSNTSNLYKYYRGSDWSDYACYCITDALGWTGGNSVYQTQGLKWRTATNSVSVVTDVTIIPKYPGVGSGAEYGGNYITRYDNHLYDEGLLHYNLNFSKTGNGTIVINAPTDGNGTMTAFTNESGNTVPSGNVRIEATPAEGYELTSLTMGGGALRNDGGYGYTFYYNNVESTMDIVATFTKIEEKKIYIYDSGNWKNARGKLFIHAWNETMSSDNGYGNYGPAMKSLGNGWYEATLSTEFTHFMISDSTNTHKSSNRPVADYVDGGRYSTANANIPSYAATEPNIAYVEVTKDGKTYFSNTVTNTTDTLSFFFPTGGTAKLYYFNSGIKSVPLSTDFSSVKDNIVTATWTGAKTATALTNLNTYDGDYYLHCSATTANYLTNGESNPGTSGTRFINFETSTLFGDTYNYYWVDWFANTQSVVATVGNTYNDDLAGVIGSDANAPAGKTKSTGGNVRYSYNPTTNTFERAIIDAGNEAIKITALAADSVLVWNGSSYNDDAYTAARNFGDATNWVYSVKAKVRGTSHASIKSTYVVEKTLASNKKLIGGEKSTKYTVEIDYDYKTNRLIAAWVPEGVITGFDLESNLMAIRTENGAPTVLNIQQADLDDDKITIDKITKIYSVLELTQASWRNSAQYASRRIDAGSWCDEYYWIALPYDCYIGDIFGMTNYGSGDNDKWVLQRYRGDLRAQKGWWAETETWWEDMSRTDTLKAGQGYVLRVTNLDGDHSSTRVFADNSGSCKLYLYFPSMGTDLELGLKKDGAALATSMTSTVPAYPCEKWRGKEEGTNEGNPRFDRRAIDSNWNIIGSPSFNSTKITSPTWSDSYPTSPNVKGSLKFFYTWAVNANNPVYTVKTNSTFSTFEFKATHAYLVQYAGDITWVPYSASNPLVELKAPKRYATEDGEQTLKLVLMQDTIQADVTYISRMAEGATEGYDLNMDLSKLTSATGNNLYTIAGYYKMAGNCLPDTTSIVPIGVQLASGGEYTFSMPDGTNGVGVVLIDNIAGTQTNLALENYTVNLTAGTYDERFMLKLSPIANVPTDIEITGDSQNDAIRKAMVDGVLYIVKEGKVFDARGNRIQ